VPALGLPLFPGTSRVDGRSNLPGARPVGAHRHQRAVRMSKCCPAVVKTPPPGADKSHMIISDTQVQLVLDYLHTQDRSASMSATIDQAGVTPDFMERVRREIALAPETRDDRVAEAKVLIAQQGMSSDQVASKMIGRILSDSIR
jgi:hypothetical protein